MLSKVSSERAILLLAVIVAAVLLVAACGGDDDEDENLDEASEYLTQLSRQEGDLRMFCTCVGEGASKEPACKHLWATLLAVDAGALVAGHPTRGNIPPFQSHDEFTLTIDEPLDDEPIDRFLKAAPKQQPATSPPGGTAKPNDMPPRSPRSASASVSRPRAVSGTSSSKSRPSGVDRSRRVPEVVRASSDEGL